jgi:hypothetical protein
MTDTIRDYTLQEFCDRDIQGLLAFMRRNGAFLKMMREWWEEQKGVMKEGDPFPPDLVNVDLEEINQEPKQEN